MINLTETHIRVLARICTPEDRFHTITNRYDPALRMYVPVSESTYPLYTITWRSCYSKNRIVKDLLKMGLIAKAHVVLYTRRRTRILDVLYPTVKGEETFWKVFGYESWQEYADPQVREYRALDEVAIDFTFSLKDLPKLSAAVKQWPKAVNIVASTICKTVQLLLALGYAGYVKIRIPKTGKEARLLLLLGRSNFLEGFSDKLHYLS